MTENAWNKSFPFFLVFFEINPFLCRNQIGIDSVFSGNLNANPDSPNQYVLTPLGRMLVQHGLEIDVTNTSHRGTVVQTEWNDVE